MIGVDAILAVVLGGTLGASAADRGANQQGDLSWRIVRLVLAAALLGASWALIGVAPDAGFAADFTWAAVLLFAARTCFLEIDRLRVWRRRRHLRPQLPAA